MASVERPEIEIVEGEVPAAAVEVAEAAVPSPKASGPMGPPATPSAVASGVDPNKVGHTVTGPLVVDADLVELPLDTLLALDLGSAEPADDLVSNTGFELLKGEAERWHRAASAVQEAVYSLQSEMDKVISIHREAPETVLDETLLPAESGPRSGMSFRELNIRRHSMVLRQQQLRAGASFWAFVYFQSLVEPEGDLAPMGSLPDSARGTALASADYLLDLLRWSINRFSKLGDLYAHTSEFMTQIQEHEASSKKQFNELTEKVHELSVSITGLQSASRVALDDSRAQQKQTHRTLENLLWQLAGSGKTVNQSMKDIVLSMAKLIQQSEQHLSRGVRASEASSEGVDGLEVHLKAIGGHLQKLVELQSKKPDEPKAAGPKMPPPPMAPTSGNAPAPGVPGGMTAPPGAVQPKLMPGSLNPPTPSAFPPSPAFPTPTFGAGIFGTPQTPTAPGATSAPAVPSAPGYKRVRLADGQWSWAEIGQGDI